MNDLSSLLSPFAALAKASERERALIGTLELAVLDSQEIVLPRVSGRKSVRVLAAEQAVLQRAEEYARHIREREAMRRVMVRPSEYSLPCWFELPYPGETFTGDLGQRLECIDVLYENTGDLKDDDAPHVLLVLPSGDSEDHDTGTHDESVRILD